MGRTLIPLEEAETALLIRASLGRGALPLAFGSAGVALIADEAPWAVMMLAQWQGTLFVDGSGI